MRGRRGAGEQGSGSVLVLGVVAGALAAYAVGLKFRFGFDDSLDVVGVHLVAGLWGTIGAGLLATEGGLFYGGGIRQTVVQIAIALAAVVVSGVVTLVIAPAHMRSMANPGTVWGRPARIATERPRVRPCSPVWLVAAIATSSTRSAGTP